MVEGKKCVQMEAPGMPERDVRKEFESGLNRTLAAIADHEKELRSLKADEKRYRVELGRLAQ